MLLVNAILVGLKAVAVNMFVMIFDDYILYKVSGNWGIEGFKLQPMTCLTKSQINYGASCFVIHKRASFSLGVVENGAAHFWKSHRPVHFWASGKPSAGRSSS